MYDLSSNNTVFMAIQSSLTEARVRVTSGKTQAANASCLVNARKIHDRFLVNGIVMLTNALRDHAEPVLNLQRAAWTAERPVEDNPRLSGKDQHKAVLRDVDSVLRAAGRPFAYPLSGSAELEAFVIVARHLEANGKHNEALQLLGVAETEQLQFCGDSPAIDSIHAHQTHLIANQMDRVDDQLASRMIEPERLPPGIKNTAKGFRNG